MTSKWASLPAFRRKGLGPSAELARRRPSTRALPLNSTPRRSSRRSSEMTVQACRGARQQGTAFPQERVRRSARPGALLSMVARMSFGPCHMVGIMGNATQRPLDVVSGGSTQIVAGPKWHGHRPASTRRPALLFGTRGLSGTIVRVKPHAGATMDVGDWLRSLGLGQYDAAFRDNEIDGAVLPKLTVDDLKDLGVAAVGHRRKILSAIEELNPPSAGPDEVARAPCHEALLPLTLLATRPSAASSPSCSATSLDRRRSQRGSIPRTCAKSSAPIRTRVRA